MTAASQLADRVRQKLITRANPNDLRAYRTQPEARERLHRLVRELVTQEASALGIPVTDATVLDVVQDLLGYGPIQPLLEDPTVNEVLVNGPEEVYVERAGRLEPVPVRFRDADHLRTVIERIVAGAGRRIDESNPMADARLPDGSRVNAVLPPVALDGPYLTIRRFARRLTADELMAAGTVTPDALAFLAAAVAARANLLVSGGTGSGKTTMLNALSSFIPPDERIVTIEDTAELQLQQPHVVRLETRPPNVEGKGEITIRHLVRNALRMRPDRIVVGEVRGGEALDMLQAMNTGHDGSLATLHANSARDALHRLEVMVLMAGEELPVRAIREQIVGAIDLIVHLRRLRDGSRRVAAITQVMALDGDVITLEPLYQYHHSHGLAVAGKLCHRLRDRLDEHGLLDHLPPALL